MELQVERISRNIVVVEMHTNKTKDSSEFLLISDLHIDNPHCRRDLLFRDLDEAVKRNAKILINGDLLCLMQGKADPRHSKGDILPQHMGPNYFNKVMEETAEILAPYAKHIAFIGYGNHETAVIKRQEFDPLQGVVTILNHKYGGNIALGGYGGWIIFQVVRGTEKQSFKIKYVHGYGGGGSVTKGVIQNQREIASVHGADAIWMGHVHELYHHVDMVERVTHNKSERFKVTHSVVHQVRTATYKDEFADGFGGFHIEKGRKPKPLGGYWMKLQWSRIQSVNRGSLLTAHFTPTSTYEHQ